jgi:HAD superfamily hydrolase (TIGR01490 family)
LNKEIVAAFFDIDHTLTRHATGIRCISTNILRRQISLKICFSIIKPYFKYKKGAMNLDHCDDLMGGAEGLSRDKLKKMGELSFRKYYKKDLYQEMVHLIEEYRKEGIPVILATSSPRFIVEPYFGYLKADNLIATELDFDENGFTNGRFAGTVAFDQGKKELVASYMKEKGYDPKKCAFYSDSIHDLPTLQMVGQPVATNPDRKLRKEAAGNNWEIIDCRR